MCLATVVLRVLASAGVRHGRGVVTKMVYTSHCFYVVMPEVLRYLESVSLVFHVLRFPVQVLVADSMHQVYAPNRVMPNRD